MEVTAVLPPRLAHALVGRPASGPLRGLVLYEALADPRLATLLLERLRMPGTFGPLRFLREPGATIASGLAPRPLATEQSNSSVVYGDAYILKVFRRIAPGINPDLEVALALARAGCRRVPAPTAWFETTTTPGAPSGTQHGGRPTATGHGAGSAMGDGARSTEHGAGSATGHGARSAKEHGAWSATGHGAGSATGGGTAGSLPVARETLTLGLLQPYLADSTDGWQYALDHLTGAAGFARVTDFTEAAHALGQATAEVHLALARSLPTTALRRPQIERLTTAMSRRLDVVAGAVPALRPYRGALRAAFADLASLGATGRCWPAQRVHGDLHLGQVLRSARDGRWTLIDFEGEPASPLAERRRPQPVVRDVAGMLRSFDYAAAVATRSGRNGRSHPAGRAEDEAARLREWARSARAAYCAGYAATSGYDPRNDPELLRAYETDKAVYEVLYEARHRPDWLPVPLSAIQRLAGPHARSTT
ncbi:phosphotransferase [Streptomyces zagrosensis]